MSTTDEQEYQDEELRLFLLPDVRDLPLTPPSAVESNFLAYFALDFMKPGHDQYVYRHANGLCVIGLAPSHVAFKDEGRITAVDFNVGKSDRSGVKVTGKRKKADREGYIAIMMPKPTDWLKVKASLDMISACIASGFASNLSFHAIAKCHVSVVNVKELRGAKNGERVSLACKGSKLIKPCDVLISKSHLMDGFQDCVTIFSETREVRNRIRCGGGAESPACVPQLPLGFVAQFRVRFCSESFQDCYMLAGRWMMDVGISLEEKGKKSSWQVGAPQINGFGFAHTLCSLTWTPPPIPIP
ncbi:protein Simiate [Senna tora]|uniref:Protein Simiate n=1 Tax=Senna tora TaxID=362788 RepID=A0A834T932_9FABA|nr:protein Simiate [Senna tora]